MKAKRVVQRVAASLAPVLHRVHAGALLDGATIAAAFLRGQGAGAGWDHNNEVATAASFVCDADPVIIDVGANKGLWTSSVAAILGLRDARYYMFEVAPYCFAELAACCEQVPRAILVKQAVSDRRGTADFQLPRVFSGLGSLHPRSDVGVRQLEYDTVSVPTVRLDDFAEEHAIDRIALLKLDIEGHELFALRGAERLLREGRIGALTFEFGSANINSRTFFRDFWDLLGGHGYRLHRMLPGGGVVPIPTYSEQLEYFRGATNYVAHRAVPGRA